MLDAELARARRAVRDRLDQRHIRAHANRSASASSEALPYLNLNVYSLFLDDAKFGAAGPAVAVNLFVPSVRRAQMFAGMRTAYKTGSLIARRLGLRLRVVAQSSIARGDARWFREVAAQEFGALDVELVDISTLSQTSFSTLDVWVCTYWSTAHTMEVLTRRGIVDPGRVIYLMQDYEPMFFPNGTVAELARRTYRAGFEPIVNSSTLAAFLKDNEGLNVPPERVFAPELDRDRLRTAAEARAFDPSTRRVLLYYRSSSARNLPEIGLSAMRCIARDWCSHGPDLVLHTVGEPHATIIAPRNHFIVGLGRLTWENYFKSIAQHDVFLSLQSTPHPSHPPLDMVASGGFAVTNDVGGVRGGLSPRLRAVEPDPEALASEVLKVLLEEPSLADTRGYDPTVLDALGGRFEDAVECATEAVAAKA